MLILAGVSLNAIIGDNGIITKAMSAKKLNSIAILQEYLQMEYTTYCDEYTSKEYGTKLDLLKKKLMEKILEQKIYTNLQENGKV